jgi:hypothetical protein
MVFVAQRLPLFVQRVRRCVCLSVCVRVSGLQRTAFLCSSRTCKVRAHALATLCKCKKLKIKAAASLSGSWNKCRKRPFCRISHQPGAPFFSLSLTTKVQKSHQLLCKCRHDDTVFDLTEGFHLSPQQRIAAPAALARQP